jgi:DNA-binding transcriptional LysR family regulator
MGQKMNLRNMDLNLLIVFDALMRERNVSRAAEAIYLSQPAMSHALKRLRTQLDDQLLVRSTNGMQPTPRALELEGPVRSILNQMKRCLEPTEDFNPSQSQQPIAHCSPAIFCTRSVLTKGSFGGS